MTKGLPWKTPTRRAFVAMLGIGAAAVVVLPSSPDPAPAPAAPRRAIWIGHC